MTGPQDKDEPKISRKRIIVAYRRPDGQLRYAAGLLMAYGGSDVLVEFRSFGVHSFGRDDGRWYEGDCTNFSAGQLLEIDEIDRAIRDGKAYDVYETVPMKTEPQALKAA